MNDLLDKQKVQYHIKQIKSLLPEIPEIPEIKLKVYRPTRHFLKD